MVNCKEYDVVEIQAKTGYVDRLIRLFNIHATSDSLSSCL